MTVAIITISRPCWTYLREHCDWDPFVWAVSCMCVLIYRELLGAFGAFLRKPSCVHVTVFSNVATWIFVRYFYTIALLFDSHGNCVRRTGRHRQTTSKKTPASSFSIPPGKRSAQLTQLMPNGYVLHEISSRIPDAPTAASLAVSFFRGFSSVGMETANGARDATCVALWYTEMSCVSSVPVSTSSVVDGEVGFSAFHPPKLHLMVRPTLITPRGVPLELEAERTSSWRMSLRERQHSSLNDE